MATTPAADLDLNESQQSMTIKIITPFAAIAILTVVARFVSRKVQRLRYEIDDFLCVVGLIFTLGCYALSCKMVQLGSGKHVGAVPPENYIPYYQSLFAYEFVYATSILAIKLSILAFYRRVFAIQEFIIISGIIGGVVIAWWIAVILVSIFSCNPINGFWDHSLEPKCINTMNFFIGNAVPNIITDVVILVLPIRMIWRLNMSKDNKISLSFVFLLGSFVVVSSCVRLKEQFKVKDPDFTWAMNGTVIWTSLEPSFGVISASLPTLRPLMVALFPKLLATSNSRLKRTSQGYNSVSIQSKAMQNGSLALSVRGDNPARLKTTITSPQKTYDPERDDILLVDRINVRKDVFSVTEQAT